MKLLSVDFDNLENPSLITVQMTTDELALLYRLTGHIGPSFVTEAAGGDIRWGNALTDIAECVGTVFNRFYEDGVNDVAPRFGIEEIAAKKAARS